jgi:hypothetical protein
MKAMMTENVDGEHTKPTGFAYTRRLNMCFYIVSSNLFNGVPNRQTTGKLTNRGAL